MNVNQKGVKGLIKVIEYFTDLGWLCFPAFDDHSPVDLIVMNPEGTPFRIQVKYRELAARQLARGYRRYELTLATIINGRHTPINRSLIDGWAVYCSDDQIVKIIPIERCLNNKTTLYVNVEENYGELSGRAAVLDC